MRLKTSISFHPNGHSENKTKTLIKMVAKPLFNYLSIPCRLTMFTKMNTSRPFIPCAQTKTNASLFAHKSVIWRAMPQSKLRMSELKGYWMMLIKCRWVWIRGVLKITISIRSHGPRWEGRDGQLLWDASESDFIRTQTAPAFISDIFTNIRLH